MFVGLNKGEFRILTVSKLQVENCWMILHIFKMDVVISCLKTLRKFVKCWCYCCLLNELNGSIIMKCKVEQ